MDKYLEFKLTKKRDRKILLIKCKDVEIPYDVPAADQIMGKYKEIIIKHSGLSVLLDLRGVKSYSTKLIWDKMGDYKKLNPIEKQHIRCAATIMKPGPMVIFAKQIMAFNPPAVKNKICYNNQEAMGFIMSN